MGNFFSRSEFKNVDKNNDGIITKQELDSWMNEQKKDIELFKVSIQESTEAKYKESILEKQHQIDEMEKQIESLKNINNNLQKTIQSFDIKSFNIEEHSINNTNNVNNKNKLKEISKKKVNLFVEQLLDDENVNIRYLPDFVERQIYRNVFNILINVMDSLVDTTGVKFMGHEIVFDLKPLPDETETESESHDTNHESEKNKKSKKNKKR